MINHPAANFKPKQKSGLTLIEIIVYIALLTIVTIAVMDLFLASTSAWGNARVMRNTNDAGKITMDRLVQEIRLAQSIESISATSITLNTFQSPTSSTTSIINLYLDDNRLWLQRDGLESIPLTGERTRVTQINFDTLNSGTSDLIRVELTVETGQGKFTNSKTYLTSVVLKGGF